MTKIILLSAPGIIRIAVIETNELLDFSVWYPGYSDGWGDIYLGRVLSHLPALGGAFVALGKELSGFLPDNSVTKAVHEGDWVTVRITRSAQGGKGVRLDARNIPDYPLPTEKSSQQLQVGQSPFEALAERYAHAEIFLDEPSLIHLIPTQYKSRVQTNKEIMNTEILEEIDSLQTAEVTLAMGMKATITPTPALVAIDMDTAIQSNDNQNKLRSQFNANRQALPQLLHHLKLRNLSGVIIVDMAGLPIKKRRLFQVDFESALQKDPLRPKFMGFTNLGLAEITRPRKRPPLHELFTSDHGRAIQILALVEQDFKTLPSFYQYHHITLTLSLSFAQALQLDNWAIQHFEQRCSVSLKIESNPSFATQQWEYHYA